MDGVFHSRGSVLLRAGTLLFFLAVQFPAFVSAQAPAPCSTIGLDSFAMTATGAALRPHHLSIKVPSFSGDVIVLVIGLNQYRHPVTQVSDTLGNTYHRYVFAVEPPWLTNDLEPDALLEVWVGFTHQTASDTITVFSDSGKFAILVGEYSHVGGIGTTAANGGKSLHPGTSLTPTFPGSYMVGGTETFTGRSGSPGLMSPYVGQELGSIATGGNKNNAGVDFSQNMCSGSSTLEISATKTASTAWATGAVELLPSTGP